MATADLLLVGRTGNGKSSTGNSILSKKEFMPKSSSSVLTADVILKGSAEIDGKTITVVDGPGLGDTGLDDYKGVESAIAATRKALSFLPMGFHALLIVLKYGVRFTKQEKDAIQMIKSIFGEDVVKNYGVIVMTHGDSFDLDVEEEGNTFEDWCKEQTGDVQNLFRECNQRCVLFNNRAKDGGKLREQYNKLMSKVTSIQTSRQPYTMNDFRKAEPSRVKLTIASRIPQLRGETERILDRVDREVHRLDDQPRLEPRERLHELKRLKDTLDEHKGELQREDQGTGSLGQLFLQLSVTEASIKTKIDICQREIDQSSYQEANWLRQPPESRRPPQSDNQTSLLSVNEMIALIITVTLLIVIWLVLSLEVDENWWYAGLVIGFLVLGFCVYFHHRRRRRSSILFGTTTRDVP